VSSKNKFAIKPKETKGKQLKKILETPRQAGVGCGVGVGPQTPSKDDFLKNIKDKLSQRKFVRPQSSILLNKGKKLMSNLAQEFNELEANTVLKLDRSNDAIENECSLS
jgi:hypothetical protein